MWPNLTHILSSGTKITPTQVGHQYKWHLPKIAVATHAESPSHVGIQGHRCSLVLCTHSPKCKVFCSAPAVTYHLGKSCCNDLCLGWHKAHQPLQPFPYLLEVVHVTITRLSPPTSLKADSVVELDRDGFGGINFFEELFGSSFDDLVMFLFTEGTHTQG